MKRLVVALLLVAGAPLCDARAETPLRHNGQPRRYTRGSFQEYLVIRNKQGNTRVRDVWNGYESNFPRPAFLYYGYPHSGDDTGFGPHDRGFQR